MIEECSKMTSKDVKIFVKDSQVAFSTVVNWTFDITGDAYVDKIHTIMYLFRGFPNMAKDIFISDVRMVSADTDKSLVTSPKLDDDEVEETLLFLSRCDSAHENNE